MAEDFILRALLAGTLVALVCGPLGSFVVWRGMAYFGDAMAQSALLGVALGLLLGVRPELGAAAVCIVLALLFTLPHFNTLLNQDALLGIMAHASLALGLVVLGGLHGMRVDLLAYLFGDVLAVSTVDIYWLAAGSVVVLAGVALLWRSLLALVVHRDLAAAEGVPVLRAQMGFTLLIAITVALAMKIVGILLITALLIIPAATARGFARSPETMAGFAAGVGVVSVAGGLVGSLQWDLPTGPAIVLAATLLFLLGGALRPHRR